MVLDLTVIAFALGGLFFIAVATVGLLRLPDLYTRAHATSKSDTLGALLSLLAVGLYFGVDVATAKVVFLALFMLVTSPTAAHAITRAAYDQGIEPWERDAGPGGDGTAVPGGTDGVEPTGGERT